MKASELMIKLGSFIEKYGDKLVRNYGDEITSVEFTEGKDHFNLGID